MSDQGKQKKRIVEGIEIIVDEAKSAAAEAAAEARSAAESLGDNLKQTLQGALSARENVVMVRLNKESLSRIDELIDAGMVNSRSGAAAFLISEGIKSRAGLFGRISEKISEIRKAKDELRELLNEPTSNGANEE